MNFNVTTAPNLALVVLPSPCIAFHDFFGVVVPGPPVAVKSPNSVAAELPVTIVWPPGMMLGKNKVTKSVFHNGRRIALDGHDCGVMIPHIHLVPGPGNILSLVQTLFSSRKVMFSAATVKMDKLPTACVGAPAPMLVCENPISLPTAIATNWGNSVVVGATAADMLAGWLGIVISMLFDVILIGVKSGKGSFTDKIKGYMADAAQKQIKATTASEIEKAIIAKLREDLLGKAFGGKTWAERGVKQAAAVAAGVVKRALTGEGQIQAGVGSPYAEAKGGTPAPNTWGVSGGLPGAGAEAARDTHKGKSNAELKKRSWDDVGKWTKELPKNPSTEDNRGGNPAGGTLPQ